MIYYVNRIMIISLTKHSNVVNFIQTQILSQNEIAFKMTQREEAIICAYLCEFFSVCHSK